MFDLDLDVCNFLSRVPLNYLDKPNVQFTSTIKTLTFPFLLVNANETSIARSQKSLTHSITQWLVNAALVALTHGVYTIFWLMPLTRSQGFRRGKQNGDLRG